MLLLKEKCLLFLVRFIPNTAYINMVPSEVFIVGFDGFCISGFIFKFNQDFKFCAGLTFLAAKIGFVNVLYLLHVICISPDLESLQSTFPHFRQQCARRSSA